MACLIFTLYFFDHFHPKVRFCLRSTFVRTVNYSAGVTSLWAMSIYARFTSPTCVTVGPQPSLASPLLWCSYVVFPIILGTGHFSFSIIAGAPYGYCSQPVNFTCRLVASHSNFVSSTSKTEDARQLHAVGWWMFCKKAFTGIKSLILRPKVFQSIQFVPQLGSKYQPPPPVAILSLWGCPLLASPEVDQPFRW